MQNDIDDKKKKNTKKLLHVSPIELSVIGCITGRIKMNITRSKCIAFYALFPVLPKSKSNECSIYIQ